MAVEPKIATANILADLDLVVRDRIAIYILYTSKKYDLYESLLGLGTVGN